MNEAMYIDYDEAWDVGFNDYGYNDTCPFIYDDLARAWRSGWWKAMTAVTTYRMMTYDIG